MKILQWAVLLLLLLYRSFAFKQVRSLESVNSWPSHLQADLVAACWRDTNLGTGGGQQP